MIKYCARCGKELKTDRELSGMGCMFADNDKYFPKFICEECGNLWIETLNRLWIKTFKEFIRNGKKENRT